MENTRKESADQYPKNFALIRLAERTLKKQQAAAEEARKAQEQEIASLEKQLAGVSLDSAKHNMSNNS